MHGVKSIQQQEQHGEKSMCHKNFKQWNMEDSFVIPLKGALKNYLKAVIAVALPLCVDNFLPHINLNIYINFLLSSCLAYKKSALI